MLLFALVLCIYHVKLFVILVFSPLEKVGSTRSLSCKRYLTSLIAQSYLGLISLFGSKIVTKSLWTNFNKGNNSTCNFSIP